MRPLIAHARTHGSSHANKRACVALHIYRSSDKVNCFLGLSARKRLNVCGLLVRQSKVALSVQHVTRKECPTEFVGFIPQSLVLG